MRKTLVLLAATAAMLALVGGSALASGTGLRNATFKTSTTGNQTIQCTGWPCYATGKSDLIYEREGNRLRDRILLRGGDDQVRANAYTRDRDVIKGSSGYDLIYVDDGDTRDKVYGGKGRDKCYVDAASEVIQGCSRIIVQ
jgi:Ca2+-binding RTX toxin-like protein